ncbi:MAG: TonB family protein, partial [Pseudomonadota bacterium]
LAEPEPSESETEEPADAPAEPSQFAFNEALRSALDEEVTGGGGETTQVAYTEAVRSAIAPRFWAAMAAVNQSGMAVVEVVILKSGKIRSSRIVQSSGVPAIDDASLEAARTTFYPPLPESIGREQLVVHIPLRVR